MEEESIAEKPITLSAKTLKEVEVILLNSETRMTRIKYNDIKLIFIKNMKDNEPFFVQRIENNMYGRVFHKGVWLHSYPHLRNIKDNTIITLEESVIEEKVNGTNIGIGRYPHGDVIRTRMNPFPEEFPVMPFFNSTIDNMIKVRNKQLLTELRTEMLSKYPDWYINAGDGEYVGLKVQEVVNHILDIKNILDTFPDLQFYFELIGKINPIIIDPELEYGFYDFDHRMVLLDIYNQKSMEFMTRKIKENIAKELNLHIAPVRYSFNTIVDMRNALPSMKEEAEKDRIEGFVLKNNVEIIKIKPDAILQSAYRLNAIMKGYIYPPDLLSYISKVVTAEHLSKPEEFENLISLIAEEAKADYSEKIINKNKGQIRKRVAETMAIMVAVKIMEEQTFEDKGALFRYINTQLPIRFAPLKSYVDFEAEQTTTDDKLRASMKRKRKAIFSKVSRYCLKVLGYQK